jgi:hypothetical protein
MPRGHRENEPPFALRPARMPLLASVQCASQTIVWQERKSEDLEGEQSPWEERALRHRRRWRGGNGLVGGARPWSRLLSRARHLRDGRQRRSQVRKARQGQAHTTIHAFRRDGRRYWRRRGGSPRRIGASSPTRTRTHSPLREARQRPSGQRQPSPPGYGSVSARQRQEGNGRSDAVRLPARGTLRRV